MHKVTFMLLTTDIQNIINSQLSSLPSANNLIERTIINTIDPYIPFAIVLTGIRRCGKSTLLHQLQKKYKNLNYLNFEDPRLINFEISDFEKVENIFNENPDPNPIYFFDEIQNVKNWEIYIRSLVDKKKHVIITGSNSSLLSRELGSRLTGRHLSYELFPFSFNEFLLFEEKSADIDSFTQYMAFGGLPEYNKVKNLQIPQQLLSDILSRDIAVRYGIRNVRQLNELIIFLYSNIGKPFSYTNLQKTFHFGSVNTVKDFISYFEDSYLVFMVPRFAYSLKKQSTNPKKIYAIDSGMANANSTSFSDDNGRILENMIYLHLRRKYKDIYYFKEKYECDFIVSEKNRVVSAIQVCYELNQGNLDREISGCEDAMKMLNLSESYIITYKQEDVIQKGDKKIFIKPAWKLMSE
jgi:predicted AAA+ superfamily ATPase